MKGFFANQTRTGYAAKSSQGPLKKGGRLNVSLSIFRWKRNSLLIGKFPPGTSASSTVEPGEGIYTLRIVEPHNGGRAWHGMIPGCGRRSVTRPLSRAYRLGAETSYIRYVAHRHAASTVRTRHSSPDVRISNPYSATGSLCRRA